ncbi:hypothetical protein H2200_008171 [Cladophialophora chaetospira]|uniref:Uncharacterized protein n=1 Tax=Cladophialophora chaetospira TaxID=386627 RepID=A0AA38X5C7_9EURO|nr:hypothetical protein H2200_008171 [Cladophialophora chaetospira]
MGVTEGQEASRDQSEAFGEDVRRNSEGRRRSNVREEARTQQNPPNVSKSTQNQMDKDNEARRTLRFVKDGILSEYDPAVAGKCAHARKINAKANKANAR